MANRDQIWLGSIGVEDLDEEEEQIVWRYYGTEERSKWFGCGEYAKQSVEEDDCMEFSQESDTYDTGEEWDSGEGGAAW